MDYQRLFRNAHILAQRAQLQAPNYRPASTQDRCNNCEYFAGQKCNKYDFAADADYICDSYEAVQPLQEFRAMVERYGARNNRLDKKTIQDMHDMACELGAKCKGADGGYPA